MLDVSFLSDVYFGLLQTKQNINFLSLKTLLAANAIANKPRAPEIVNGLEIQAMKLAFKQTLNIHIKLIF